MLAGQHDAALTPEGARAGVAASARKRWPIVLAVLLPLVSVASIVGLRLLKPAPQLPSFLGATLGAEAIAGVADAGFYNDELAGPQPFRWTDGHAKLVIPLRRGELPRSLEVHVVALRPAGAKEATLEIKLNGRSLINDVIPLGPWERTFDLEELPPGANVTLELLSDTFVPGNHDSRRLGIQVTGVRLLATAEESPRGVEQPGHPLDPGLVVLEGEPAEFACAAITIDGRMLVSGSLDGTLRVWDVANRRQVFTIRKRLARPAALAISLGGHIAAADHDGAVQLLSHSGQARARVRGAGPTVASMAFSFDSSTLAIAGAAEAGVGALALWDLKTRKERILLDRGAAPLRTLAYAPHGRSVAVVADDGSAQVVNVSGKIEGRFVPPQPARRAAYSSNLSKLAVAHGAEGQVTIYAIASGRPSGAVVHPGGKAVVALMFARDDRRLLTVDSGGTAFYWDLTRSPARAVGSPCVLPQHVWLAPVFQDRLPTAKAEPGTIRVWRVGPAT